MILQKGGDEQADLSDVRCLFDSLIQKFPSTRYHLGADTDLIMNKAFVNAVVKVQSGLEEHLSRPEKAEIKRFLLETSDANEENEDDDDVDSMTRRHKQHQEGKRRRVTKPSKYRCLNYIYSATNCVERLLVEQKLL